jgi:hypothetical protein
MQFMQLRALFAGCSCHCDVLLVKLPASLAIHAEVFSTVGLSSASSVSH